jgi:hypothetical protein
MSIIRISLCKSHFPNYLLILRFYRCNFRSIAIETLLVVLVDKLLEQIYEYFLKTNLVNKHEFDLPVWLPNTTKKLLSC